MKTSMIFFASAIWALLVSVEGQAATFTNTTPVQMLSSTYYYDLFQHKIFFDTSMGPNRPQSPDNSGVPGSTMTERKNSTTDQPFSDSLLIGQHSSNITDDSYYSKADGSAFALDTYSSSGNPGYRDGGTGNGYAFASGTWQFVPLANDYLSVSMTLRNYSSGYIVLTDLNTNQIAFSNNGYLGYSISTIINLGMGDYWKGTTQSSNYNGNDDGKEVVTDYALNIGHTYQLDMGLVTDSANDRWRGSVSANLKAVPLPLPFWLFASGLAFMCRRKFIRT